MTTAGLLLAAGGGTRMGSPKGLLRDEWDVPYLDRVLGNLFEGGCDLVTVVLGAAGDHAAALLADAGWDGDPAVRVVVAPDWAEGMSASLRAGLTSLADSPADCAVVMLVDLPDVGPAVLARVVGTAAGGAGANALVRATYHGTPGHPVLLGRAHWPGVLATCTGDRGARDYLSGREVLEVECGDLASGRDVDRPEDLRR